MKVADAVRDALVDARHAMTRSFESLTLEESSALLVDLLSRGALPLYAPALDDDLWSKSTGSRFFW